jgi:hypothetical protein
MNSDGTFIGHFHSLHVYLSCFVVRLPPDSGFSDERIAMSNPLDLSDNTDPIEALELIYKSNQAREVRLPSGGCVLVSPFDGLTALAEALDTPQVRSVLRECAAQFAAGDIEPIEIQKTPARAVTGKKKATSRPQRKTKATSKRGQR